MPRRIALLPTRLPGVLALLLLLAAGCSDDGSPETQTGASLTAPEQEASPADERPEEPTETTEPSTPPSTVYAPGTEEAEVEHAFLTAWVTFQRAIVDEVPSVLPSSFGEPALGVITEQVEGLIADGQSIRLDFRHQLSIAIVAPGVAAVVNTLENHSVTLDRDSGLPTEPDPDETKPYSYTLREGPGGWKIHEIIEIDVSQAPSS